MNKNHVTLRNVDYKVLKFIGLKDGGKWSLEPTAVRFVT